MRSVSSNPVQHPSKQGYEWKFEDGIEGGSGRFIASGFYRLKSSATWDWKKLSVKLPKEVMGDYEGWLSNKKKTRSHYEDEIFVAQLLNEQIGHGWEPQPNAELIVSSAIAYTVLNQN